MKKKSVIAVFENDALNRFIYQRMLALQEEKVESYIFTSAEEGLEVAKHVSFDIAFIDLHFQGMHKGIEVARKLKTVSDKTILVGMTTLIQKGDTELTTAEGFVACLEKPLPFYDVDKLFSDIGR
ncbi:MAG: response regulator [Cyclobacteriaceae bacterium]